MMNGDRYFMAKRILFYTVPFILLFIISGSLYADVTATGSQSPPETEDVPEGVNPVYTITVTNLDQQSPTFPDITIQLEGVDVSTSFTSFSNCELDGETFFCDQLGAGATIDYQFQWNTPPVVGVYPLTFVVGCSNCEGVDSVAITTSVVSAVIIPPDPLDLRSD